jgi:hypothetical protein
VSSLDTAGYVEPLQQLTAPAAQTEHLDDRSRDLRLLVPIRRQCCGRGEDLGHSAIVTDS